MRNEEREALWSAVDELVRQHRAFATADWALSADEVDRLADIADRLEPKDPVQKSKWLFHTHLPDLGDKRGTVTDRMEDVAVARTKAIVEILDSGGLDAVLRLAQSVDYPGFVGVATAPAGTAQLDAQLVDLLDRDDRHLASLAHGYSVERARIGGWAWIREGLKTVTGRALAQARLLQVTEDLRDAWRLAAELGQDVEQAYWAEFSPMGRGSNFPLVNEAVERLLTHDRVVAAIDLMALYSREDGAGPVSPELIVQGLERLVESPPGPEELQRLSSYELNLLLERLRASSLDEERLALLEWRLLPALGLEARSPVLHRRLARDPEFFVEILSLLYRPRGDVAPETESTPEHVASNAWRLLHEWKIVPGSSDQMGTVDENGLMQWTTRSRELLSEADRREVGDIHIGHVFAHARGDDDETWPTRPVRNAIERFASSDIEDGFRSQTYNNRGVTSRDPAAGGDAERSLAARYRKLAALVRDEWPRTAAVLSSLADGYEREGLGHDEYAERIRQGLDE